MNMVAPAPSDRWWNDEVARLEFSETAWDVASAAELPRDLIAHVVAAEADRAFADQFEEWRDFVYGSDSAVYDLLAIARCCDDGVLQTRSVALGRLADAPLEFIGRAIRFLNDCPRHVAALVAHEAFWCVKAARARSLSTDLERDESI